MAKTTPKKATATKPAAKKTATTTRKTPAKKATPTPASAAPEATAPAAPAATPTPAAAPIAPVASAAVAVASPPAAAPATPAAAPAKKEKTKPADFGEFLSRLKRATDPAKIDKALKMLRAERFKLFAKVTADHMIGVVKSQTDPDLVYSCRLASDGSYACCTQNLNACGGLRGSPCKHLLVLIVGLTQAGELAPGTAHDWTQASKKKQPALDKDVMTATFLQYKGAEAGEVDWRPTETIPEDFYAM